MELYYSFYYEAKNQEMVVFCFFFHQQQLKNSSKSKRGDVANMESGEKLKSRPQRFGQKNKKILSDGLNSVLWNR